MFELARLATKAAWRVHGWPSAPTDVQPPLQSVGEGIRAAVASQIIVYPSLLASHVTPDSEANAGTRILWSRELSDTGSLWEQAGSPDSAVNDECRYASRFLRMLIHDGPDHFIANADGVEMGIALLGGQVPLPLSRPRAGRSLTPHTSYTASPFAHFVQYVEDEYDFHAGRLPTILAARGWSSSWLRHLGVTVCTTPIRMFLWGWSVLCKLCNIDTAIYINNWLLSTSLHPSPTSADPKEAMRCAQLDALLRQQMLHLRTQVVESHPSHALVYRSLDGRSGAGLLATLDELGFYRVPARYVHYQDANDPALWRLNNIKHDQRLERNRLSSGGRGGAYRWHTLSTTDMEAPLADLLCHRVVEVYEMLYVDKYSPSNPRFTPSFVDAAVRHRLLTILVLVNETKTGPENVWQAAIDGVIGYFVRGHFMTTPLFGYDTSLPPEAGMYRLLSLRMLKEARCHGVHCHASGGVARFKQLRGARSTVEVCMVYTRHLPWHRRLPWLILHYLGWHGIVRLAAIPGGPTRPVESLADSSYPGVYSEAYTKARPTVGSASASRAASAPIGMACAPTQPLRLFVAAIITQVLILWCLGLGRSDDIGPQLLSLQLCFEPSRFRALTESWSNAQLDRFSAHFWLDMWYPLLYGLVCWRRAAALFWRPCERRARCTLQVLAATAALCDLVENMLHFSVLPTLHTAPDWLILWASSAATAKWIMMMPVCWFLQPFRTPTAPLPQRARALVASLTRAREDSTGLSGNQDGIAAVMRASVSSQCGGSAAAAATDGRVERMLVLPLERHVRKLLSFRRSRLVAAESAIPFLTVENAAVLTALANGRSSPVGGCAYQLASGSSDPASPGSSLSAHITGAAPQGHPALLAKPSDAIAPSPPSLDQLRGKHVLVTGATGFLGTALVHKLLQIGVSVTATGRDESKGSELEAIGAHFVRAELTDAAAVEALCRGQFAVVHCAALCQPWPASWTSQSVAHEQANVHTTACVLRGCVVGGVRRLVHISTPSLYSSPGKASDGAGAAGLEGVPEWCMVPSPAQQPNHYAKTKLRAEELVQSVAVEHMISSRESQGTDGLCTVVLRPRALFGPGDPTILPRILDSICKRRLPVIGPHTLVDLTPVDNCAHAAVLALVACPDDVHGRTFNITNDEPVRLWAVLRSLCENLELPAPRLQLPVAVVDCIARFLVEPTTSALQALRLLPADFEPRLTRYAVTVLGRSCLLDSSAARTSLGFEPPVSTQQALQAFITRQKDETGQSQRSSLSTPPSPNTLRRRAQVLPHSAIAYWARVDPTRTAVLHTRSWVPSRAARILDALLLGAVAVIAAATSLRAVLAGQLYLSYTSVVVPSAAAIVLARVCYRLSTSLADAVAAATWERVSYRSLAQRIHSIEVAMRAHGLSGRRVLVLIAPPSRADALALLLGLQAAGCTLVWADPKAIGVRRWLRLIFTDVKPHAVITGTIGWTILRILASATGTWPSGRDGAPRWIHASKVRAPSSIHARESPSSTSHACGDAPPDAANADELERVVIVTLTTGSTGDPKPVEITQRMLVAQAVSYAASVSCASGSIWAAPLHWRSSLESLAGGARLWKRSAAATSSIQGGPAWVSLHTFLNIAVHDLTLGATALLHPMGLADPAQTVCPIALHHIFNQFGVTVFSGSVAVWRNLVNALPSGALRQLQVGLVTGAELSPTLQAQASRRLMRIRNTCPEDGHRRLLSIYGATEGLPLAVGNATDALSSSSLRRCALGGGVLLGQPSEGLRVRIDVVSWRRRGGQPLERAVLDAPQLITGGASPALPSELVRLAGMLSHVGELCLAGDLVATSPVKGQRESWFCTGDLCAIDDAGHIWFLGRIQQAVPVGGLLGSVPPVAVEMVCMQTSLLQRCALVGISRCCKAASIWKTEQRVRQARAAAPGSTFPSLQRPVVVLQRENDELGSLDEVIAQLTAALASSVWAKLLDTSGFCFLEYPGTWPVDSRHSSKTDRLALGRWAARLAPVS